MSPRPVAAPEIERILALVPWIVAHPGTPPADIAQRFATTVEQLEEDLDLVLMVGVPPYSPGDYLDVEIGDDGGITIRLADTFRRPLRLTPAEGLALLAAGRALLAVSGSDPEGPLATALAKLAEALELKLPDLVVDVGEPPYLAAVRDAAAGHDALEIDYWSAGRDELTTRRVDPAIVFYALGAWYLAAYCHRAGADRMFRVDRIRGLRVTGEKFEPGASDVDTPEVYTPRVDDVRVTLRLAPAAAWVAEAHPTEAVTERSDGGLDVVLAISEHTWLERLLVRLGPDDAEIVAPEDLRDAAAASARRILNRYTSGKPGAHGSP